MIWRNFWQNFLVLYPIPPTVAFMNLKCDISTSAKNQEISLFGQHVTLDSLQTSPSSFEMCVSEPAHGYTTKSETLKVLHIASTSLVVRTLFYSYYHQTGMRMPMEVPHHLHQDGDTVLKISINSNTDAPSDGHTHTTGEGGGGRASETPA